MSLPSKRINLRYGSYVTTPAPTPHRGGVPWSRGPPFGHAIGITRWSWPRGHVPLPSPTATVVVRPWDTREICYINVNRTFFQFLENVFLRTFFNLCVCSWFFCYDIIISINIKSFLWYKRFPSNVFQLFFRDFFVVII